MKEENETIELLTINKLISKKFPVVKALIAMKTNLSSSYIFYFFILYFKLLGIIILSNRPWIQEMADNKFFNQNSMSIIYGLNSFTLFDIFSNILNYRAYSIFCYVLFVIELIYLIIFYIYYRYCKFTSDSKKINSTILRIYTFLFNFNLIFSQHLIELFTFIFPIYFKIGNPNGFETNSNALKYRLFFFDVTNYEIILLILNTILIIFLNFHIYYSFILINEPYFLSYFPINLRSSNDIQFLFILISNLQALHYIELILYPGSFGYLLYKFIIFCLISFGMIFILLKRFRSFNFSNLFNKVTFFLFSFCFFSYTLEFTLYLTRCEIKQFTHFIFILFWKILFSLSFVSFYNSLTEYYFSKRCSDKLFKVYDGRFFSDDEIECFYFFINLIIKFKKQSSRTSNSGISSSIVNIIKNHKLDCGVYNCRCNIIKNISEFDTLNLSSQINELIESTMALPNFIKNKNGNFLLTEYLFIIKRSNLFSYSVINYLISNSQTNKRESKKYSNLDLYEMYGLLMIFVQNYRHKISQSHDYVDFKNIYSKFKHIKSYDKLFYQVAENFEIFINFKEKFIGSLKFNQKILKFDSFILNSLDILTNACRNFKIQYFQIKSHISKEKKSNLINIELAYKIFSFYFIFNKFVPDNILSMICIERMVNNHYKYFNTIFNKYFSENSNQSIILEIKDKFKIKYFSYILGMQLGYDNGTLIGRDIHEIIPESLRDSHKKVILNNFLIKRNSLISFKTNLFTRSKNLISASFNISLFIDLNKNLTAIGNIKILERPEKNCYKFILNENFEILGLSKNFETQFHLDYDAFILQGIKIVNLFGVGDIILKHFKKKLDKLEKLKLELEFDTLQCLFKFIFLEETTNPVIIKDIMSKLDINKSKETAYLKNLPKVNSILRDSSPRTSLAPFNKSSIRPSVILIDKDIKKDIATKTEVTGNNSSNSSITDNLYFDSKDLIIVRDKRNVINNLKKLIARCQETNGLNDEVQQKKLFKSLECFEINKNSKFFRIKIKLKKMYTTPFYIFSFREEEKFKLTRAYTMDSYYNFNSFNSELLSQPILNERNLNYTPPSKNQSNTGYYRNANNSKFNLKEKSKSSKEKQTQQQLNLDASKIKIIKKEKKRISRQKKLEYVLALFLIFNISISIFVFYFKSSSILVSKSLFFISYWNNMQQSSLGFLHSGILSLVLKLDNLTKFNTHTTEINNQEVNEEDIKRVLSNRIDSYRENFAKFLESIRNSTHKMITLEDMLYKQSNYNKTLLTWQNINSDLSFLTAQQYITINTRLMTEEKDFLNLKYDFENGLLFKRYNTIRNEPQLSKHSELIYFMNNNVPFIFYEYFMKFKNIIAETTVNYNDYWINLSTVFEVAEMGIAFFIFLFIYLILRNYDKTLFSYILALFLNLKTGKKDSYKLNSDMTNIKSKIKSFKELLSNFTVQNIRKMDSCLNEFDFINNTVSNDYNYISMKNISINSSMSINSSFAALNPNQNNFSNSKFKGNFDYTNSIPVKGSFLGSINYEMAPNHLINNQKENFNFQPGKFNPKSFLDNDKNNDKISSFDYDMENTLITNSKVYKNTKHYQIRIVKILQLSSILILFIYISFLTFNFLSNYLFFSTIDNNINISNCISNRIPIITYIFNDVRLMIIENEKRYTDYYKDFISDFEKNDEEYIKFFNLNNNELPMTLQYAKNINNIKNLTLNKNELLCKNDRVCSIVVLDSFNSKGLNLAVRSVLQELNNLYKDYNKVVENSHYPYIPSKEKITEYFKNEAFENVNLQIEFVLDNANKFFMEYVKEDMLSIFNFFLNLNIVLGLISISFNFIIIAYLFFGYFSQLNNHLEHISYSTEKLNKVLY